MRKEILSVLGGLLTSAATLKSRERQGTFERRIVHIDSADYDYQIYIPPGFRNEQNLPLIIFLHGIGQRGSGGFVPTEGAAGALVRHYFAGVPALVLLPQCRLGSYWSDPVMERMVMQALAQTIEKFRADAARVFLTGVSMGGYGVWHLASNHAETFAALVSICGGSSILSGDRFTPVAEKVSRIPAWVFHGADDKIVPISESRELVKAIRANGGEVKYSEYPGVGHNVWLNALAEKELMPWLLAQRLG